MTSVLNALLNCIFPPRCAVCDNLMNESERGLICPTCAGEIKYVSPPWCPICGLPYRPPDVNHICGECIKDPPVYQIARALGIYEPPLLELIHKFKYRGYRTIGKYLGKMMAERYFKDLDFSSLDLIIPVPLHNGKLRRRSFNQALVLAKEVSKKYNIPCRDALLKRTVNTKSQVALPKEERKKNVRGAFSLTNAHEIKDKNILLIDDVYTTGGTVNECARLLLEKGAKSIYVCTLARTV
ncbi:MAG: ComF family protein [Syntrophales bacterium]|nr:ComF family protein [Syntrophales bacterium]